MINICCKFLGQLILWYLTLDQSVEQTDKLMTILQLEGQKGVKIKPRRLCSEDRWWNVLLHVCSQTADSALTHVWPCGDDTRRALVPLHTDLSQGSLLTLHATTDNTNHQYYLEHMEVYLCVSDLCKVFAAGTQTDSLQTEVLTETRQKAGMCQPDAD